MNKVLRRRQEEDGAVLVLALAFLAIFGVLAAILANYASTNIRATINLRPVRAVQFGADAAVETAINRVRFNSSLQNSAVCLAPQQFNAHWLRVGCAADLSVPETPKVTLVASQCSTATCADPREVLRATVEIDRRSRPGCPAAPGPSRPDCVPSYVSAWSVKK